MLEIETAVRRIGLLDTAQPIFIGAQVTIRARPSEGRIVLRLSPEIATSYERLAGMNFSMPINRASFGDGRIAARLGPDEWLFIGHEADTAAVLSEAADQLSAHHHALIDIGHRNIAIEISGRAAAGVLNAGCPLDLNDDHFPPGHSTRTLLGKAEVVLIRLSDTIDTTGNSDPRYRVECWRSFGQYLHRFLIEAAQEYNVH